MDENINKQEKIKSKIFKLEVKLKELQVEEYLLHLSTKIPIIISCNDQIGKYKYLTCPLSLSLSNPVNNISNPVNNVVNKVINMIIYPIWITMECTYPKWSRDINSLNIIRYKDFNTGKGYETLINTLSNTLNLSYNKARKMIKTHRLSIPYIYEIPNTCIIDFSQGKPIEYYQHKNNTYYLQYTDDKDMMMNTVKVKFFLITTPNTKNFIDFL